LFHLFSKKTTLVQGLGVVHHPF